MSRQNDIDDAIWEDIQHLSPEAKLVYIWSFTNPRPGMAGLYKVRAATIAHETGYTDGQVAEALAELERERFAFHDGSWMYVRARVKKLRTRTVQMCRAVARQVSECPPDHPYRLMLVEQDGDGFWASRDDRTTIRRELDASTVGPEYHQGGTPGLPPQGGSIGPTQMPPRWHKGKGKGQGKGRGSSEVGGPGEGTNWHAWAQTNLPDLPPELVAMVAGRLATNRPVMNPDEVRQIVLDRHPHLREENAA